MEEKFRSYGSKTPRVVVLCGMGGQGKSQLALEYCHREETTYRGLFWINASSEATTLQSFSNIAEELDPSQSESSNTKQKFQFVAKTLKGWEDRWLMVFDNYDVPWEGNKIKSYLPAGTSCI